MSHVSHKRPRHQTGLVTIHVMINVYSYDSGTNAVAAAINNALVWLSCDYVMIAFSFCRIVVYIETMEIPSMKTINNHNISYIATIYNLLCIHCCRSYTLTVRICPNG